jgi:hypothetical protein
MPMSMSSSNQILTCSSLKSTIVQMNGEQCKELSRLELSDDVVLNMDGSLTNQHNKLIYLFISFIMKKIFESQKMKHDA